MSAFDIALEYHEARLRRAQPNPYHLTTEETAMARQLLGGGSLPEIAASRNEGEDEVQRRIATMCDKVGANGLTRLLHILSTLPGVRIETNSVDVDDFRIAFGPGAPLRRA